MYHPIASMMRLHLIETAEDIIRNGGKGSDSQMIAVGPSSTPIKASPSAAENAGGKSIRPASLPPPPKVPATMASSLHRQEQQDNSQAPPSRLGRCCRESTSGSARSRAPATVEWSTVRRTSGTYGSRTPPRWPRPSSARTPLRSRGPQRAGATGRTGLRGPGTSCWTRSSQSRCQTHAASSVGKSYPHCAS